MGGIEDSVSSIHSSITNGINIKANTFIILMNHLLVKSSLK
jgi:hypothetical protein